MPVDMLEILLKHEEIPSMHCGNWLPK